MSADVDRDRRASSSTTSRAGRCTSGRLPYVGTYLLLRIDDRAAGRELVRRLHGVVDSGPPTADPAHGAWITGGVHLPRPEALGVPQDSLDSFAPEFRAGDGGAGGRARRRGREQPRELGDAARHAATSTSRSRRSRPTRSGWRPPLEQARRAHAELPGVELIWRQDCYQLPTGRTSFGFKDGIGQPAVEGSGMPPTNPQEPPLKAGEIILGYPDETGELPPMPTPDVLGRNGTYVVFRKLHTKVAAYRQYLRAKAASREEEALLGAKMVGRWQSGAPLARRPGARRPRARRRPAPQQRLPLRRRPARLQVPGRRARAAREPARRARPATEASTCGCTA